MTSILRRIEAAVTKLVTRMNAFSTSYSNAFSKNAPGKKPRR